MRTFLKILVALVVVAMIAVVVLLFTDFDSPRLSQTLIRLAASSFDADLEVEQASLNLRRGLVLEGVVVRSEAEGERLTVSLDRLLLEHRLWPLLKGQVLVERLVIERPVIEMLSHAPGSGGSQSGEKDVEAAAAESSTAPDESSRLLLEIGEVVIEQGRLVSTSSAEAGSTVLDGLDLVLRGIAVDPEVHSLLLAISGEGWLEADSLALDERRLTGIEAAFEADRGRYRLAEFETSTAAGDLSVEEIEFDLAQDPYRYRVAIRADEIDLNHLLGLSGGLGASRLELRGNGEGPGLAGAVAEMTLWLEAGTLPSVTLLRRIDRLMGSAIDAAGYEALDLRLSLAGGILDVDPLEIVTEFASLEMSGSMDLEGPIDLKVAVGISRDLFYSQDVSKEVLDMLTDRSDWLTIPLRVTGTIDSPRFLPDLDVVKQKTRYMAEEARDSLRTKFRSELSGAIRRRLG